MILFEPTYPIWDGPVLYTRKNTWGSKLRDCMRISKNVDKNTLYN